MSGTFFRLPPGRQCQEEVPDTFSSAYKFRLVRKIEKLSGNLVTHGSGLRTRSTERPLRLLQ
jgi:hypothetical protein